MLLRLRRLGRCNRRPLGVGLCRSTAGQRCLLRGGLGIFFCHMAQINAAFSAAGGSQGRAHRAVDRIEHIAFPRKTALGFGGVYVDVHQVRRQINAQDVLDIAMAGTSATLLAKRWESALLVNVDNGTLSRLLASKEALDALMNIEGFRSLNSDIQTIINKSEAVKKAKKEGEEKLTPKEKKELSDEEKEYKSMRKQIQEKLIKFATRVPIFMYLTDYRERSLKDVIAQLEPGLFKKVTGLDVKDFNLLVELNVFNASLMNDAFFKFKRYEDSSLSYTGLDKHENEDVGGWDTVVKRKEYELLFYNQQSTMNAPEIDEADVPEADEEPEPPKAPVPTRTPPAKPDFVTAAFGVKSPIAPAKPQQPEQPKADVSGVSVGSAVAHAKFGIGKVIELNRGYVTVRFEQGEKRFLFPYAFESGFLKAQ